MSSSNASMKLQNKAKGFTVIHWIVVLLVLIIVSVIIYKLAM